MSGRMRGLLGKRDPGQAGQALVEFAISVTVFLLLLMALFDFGRAIYTYNGLAQAAREVARTASVHMGTSDWTDEADATIATQRNLVPGLDIPLWKCVASADVEFREAFGGNPTRMLNHEAIHVHDPERAIRPSANFHGTKPIVG